MKRVLKALLLKLPAVRDLWDGRTARRNREAGVAFPLSVDYEVRPRPRYGYGRPPHPGLRELLAANRSQYRKTLQALFRFKSLFYTIPVHRPDDLETPYWLNGYFQGLDALSLYAFAVIYNPRLYIEIGSGNSTRFMRRAIREHQLQTRIISIDPNPRAEIDRLCDEVRRERLEDTDLTLFQTLAAGDIVFLDGSHRVFMNSDATAFFLDVLPCLPRGVLVYIDDIYLPLDYPPSWTSRYYSEQYLLAVLLLAGGQRYEVLLPCVFISGDADLRTTLDPFWKDVISVIGSDLGNGFWLRVR